MWQNHQDLIALGKQGKDMEVYIKCSSFGLQNMCSMAYRQSTMYNCAKYSKDLPLKIPSG